MTGPVLLRDAHDVLVEETPAGLIAHEPRPGHLAVTCGDNAFGYYSQPWYSVQHAGGRACLRCYPPDVEPPRSFAEQVADLLDDLHAHASNFDRRIEAGTDRPMWLRPGDDVARLLDLMTGLAAGAIYLNAAFTRCSVGDVIANVRGHVAAALHHLDEDTP